MRSLFVERRGVALYVRGTEIPVAAVLACWGAHHSGQALRAAFPRVPLTNLYGAIVYALESEDMARPTFADTARAEGGHRSPMRHRRAHPAPPLDNRAGNPTDDRTDTPAPSPFFAQRPLPWSAPQ